MHCTYKHSDMHSFHYTWLGYIKSCIKDSSHGFLTSRWLVHSWFMDLGHPLEVTLPHSQNDGWSWSLGWVSYGKYTSVSGYTLNKTYSESWHKALRYSWLYQVVMLYCLSTLREFWGCVKVSNGFDLRVRF